MDRKEAERRAKELVAEMTLAEVASQLRYDSPAIERLGIPEYNWWNEGLHGVARAGIATVFPQAIGMGATFNDELVKEIGNTIAREARAKYNEFTALDDRTRYKGLTLWAPNINIFRDPRWGRGQETFGEDPYLTSKLGCAMVDGLQTQQDGYMMTAACAKHMAVHSGPEELRHEFNAEASMKDMWETYLPAFEACVKDANVEAVMGAYNRTNGEPCCAHSYFIKDVLRDKWQFEGHFVSDCWAVRDFHEKHHITETPEQSAALAIKTGCDLNCGCTYQNIMSAYEQGLLTREDLDICAVRIFTTRFLLGMFDETSMDSIDYKEIACKKNLELAHKAAVESCVLLKNDGILPLDMTKYKKVAVMGPNADSQVMLMGNYCGTPPRAVTLVEGIRERFANQGVETVYAEGSHLYRDNPQRPHLASTITEAELISRDADLIIVCVGLDSTIEGEQGDVSNEYASGDKPNLLLPSIQRKLLDRIVKIGKPFIILNASGSPIDLSMYEEAASAILQIWYPGGEGGLIVADVLMGKDAPCGKLPVTFYYDSNNIPDITDYSMKNRTYRYMQEKPWHGFGYGLTYGELKIDSAVLTASQQSADYNYASKNGLSFEVACSNAGERAVSEVIQVYVHVNGTDNEVDNYKLAAFKRIKVENASSDKFIIEVPAAAFTTVDDNGLRAADGNGADIYIGFSQPGEAGITQECIKVQI